MSNSQFPKRKPTRLQKFDYSSDGAYFITIVTQNRIACFGEIVDLKMVHHPAGLMISVEWKKLPDRFPNLTLGEYVVMPNHFHGILLLSNAGLGNRHAGDHKGRPYVGEIIGAFKSITTHQYIKGVETQGWDRFDKRLWQRNFHDRIIRDEEELNQIREYIQTNPVTWADDQEYTI